MKRSRLSIVATLVMGIVLAIGVVGYASSGTGTGAAASPTITSAAYTVTASAAKKLTKAQKEKKLKAALKACKKQYKSKKSKLKACEKKAKKQYPVTTREITKTKTTSSSSTTSTTTTPTAPHESPTEEKTRAQQVNMTPEVSKVTAGKKIFESDCEACHGPEGNGTENGVDLHEAQRAQSIPGVIEQLIEPLGTMPKFDASLTFEEKEEVADYVAVEITKVAPLAH